MPSSHLILCCPLLLLPPIPPSIRVFSNASTLCMRWPKYWSFSFSISPSKEAFNVPHLVHFCWHDRGQGEGFCRAGAQSCLTLCDPMNCSTPGRNSRSSLRVTSIQSVMPSSHLILHRPLLLLPPSPPSIRVFPNESTLCMRWPKYWSFSFNRE